jgi:O-antigen/teichoic acid export membrane protein
MAALFASFTKPKAIFFRKYVLAPGLKLAAVGLLIALQAPVTFLAWAYVVTSLFGVLLYGVMLVQFLRAQGWLEHLHPRSLRFPAREVFTFTIPLLTADLVYTAMLTASTFFLGYFHGETAVAQYRAVVPAARLNMLVMNVFQLLYTPQAARLFARNDMRGIDNLYWRTAVWIAVLSFPIFALTFSMARPLTTTLFGERYAAAWPLLQILSFGFYFNAATGFNGITLKVLGKLRYAVAINLGSMALCAILCVVWVPRFGALGAAIATTTALFAHNLLKQAGLRLVGGLRVFDPQCLSFYALIAGAAAGLVVLQMVALRSIWTAVPVAASVSLVVLWAARHRLRIDATFPELARVPFVGRTLGVPRRRPAGAGGGSDAVGIVREEAP